MDLLEYILILQFSLNRLFEKSSSTSAKFADSEIFTWWILMANFTQYKEISKWDGSNSYSAAVTYQVIFH